MNTEKLEEALRALTASQELNQKFANTLQGLIDSDTEEIEEMFWNNIIQVPLNLIMNDQSLILPKHSEIIINYIGNAIELYEKNIQHVFSQSKSRTTFVTHNQNANHRVHMMRNARCYSKIARLYRYQFKLDKNKETRAKILENYHLSFITDTSSLYILIEICQFLKSEYNDYNSLIILYYSVKALYLFNSPEANQNLTEICDFLISLTNDVSDTKNSSEMAKFIKCVKNKDWNVFEELVEKYSNIINQITTITFENLDKENVCDNYYMACAISIFILDDLRREDSTKFESTLLHFSKLIGDSIEKLTIILSPKKDDKNNDSSEETFTDSPYMDSNEHLNLEESEDDSDGERNITYNFDFMPDRKGLEGLRSFNKPSENKQQNSNELKSNIASILKGIKLILDWFTGYNMAVNLINEISGFDIEKSLKKLYSCLAIQDIPIEPKRFLPEDFAFFGHPPFSDVHQKIDLSNISFIENEGNSKYRINYILNVINQGDIFNAYPKDPSIYQISNNVTWSNKRPRSNGCRDYSRRHNKSNTDPFSMDNQPERQRGFVIKNSRIQRVHIISFYDVLCRLDFVTDLLYGKVFRVFVPYSALYVIDRIKNKDHMARRTARFLSKNCYPRMKGLRIQSSQEFQKLEKTTAPKGCDEKTFNYVDAVLKTGLSYLKNTPVSEPVVVLISKFEKKSLFGGEDLTELNRDQVANLNCLLKPTIDRGLRVLTIEEFKEEFIV